MKYKERKREYRVKYCTICKTPWENTYVDNRKDKKSVSYHPHLPTYGMDRQTCYKCK